MTLTIIMTVRMIIVIAMDIGIGRIGLRLGIGQSAFSS